MDTYTFTWMHGPTASLIVDMKVRHTNASTNTTSERTVIGRYKKAHVTVHGMGRDNISVSIIDMPVEYLSNVVLEILDRHAETNKQLAAENAEAKAAVAEAKAALNKVRTLVGLPAKE